MNQLQAEQEEQVRNTTRSKFNILKIENWKFEIKKLKIYCFFFLRLKLV